VAKIFCDVFFAAEPDGEATIRCKIFRKIQLLWVQCTNDTNRRQTQIRCQSER